LYHFKKKATGHYQSVLRSALSEAGGSMKSTLLLISMPALTFLTSLAISTSLSAQTYTVTDLGPANNPFSQAAALDDFGLISGVATAADGSQHAVIWLNGVMTDIGKPGLGGPNSGGGGVNQFGQVIGGAETSSKDPNNENFCGYGTGLRCAAFLWRNGAGMTALPTLGGTNAAWGGINNLGQVAGYAETATRDATCPGKVAVNGTGPQLFDFEAVIWGPKTGQIQELPPLAGDTVAMANSINDYGVAVGMSGTCANTVIGGFAGGPHAVLWESNGSVHDLGNLGGTVNTNLLGAGTLAWVINNRGVVTGQSDLAGNQAFHPFLWSRETGMLDLGVLPGDLVGAGLSINNSNQIVGASVSAPGPASGNPRAFLWQHGVMTDLNTLIPATSGLYLLTAFGINDAGVIVGFGVTGGGDVHGFVATPAIASGSAAFLEQGPARPAALSDNARKTLLHLWRPGR
jgi:probable HAF family extracellular repeat protein